MQIRTGQTLGDIVAADHRAAAVFDRFGVDFCCGGGRTIDEACRQPGVDSRALLVALGELAATGLPPEDNVALWPLDVLVDHIVSRHHAYVRATLPALRAQTAAIAEAHGGRRPELPELARRFAGVAGNLDAHMDKEEQILFPYILSLVESDRAGRRVAFSPFGTIRNPIRMMEAEHQDAGDELGHIRGLAGNYVPPSFACATYRACFTGLDAFERDLHRHVWLENHVLFPRAAELEASLD